MKGIGGGDEKDLGQVIIHIQVMVIEGEVLFRVEHLQQGRRGVAPEIRAHLVHFVQAEDRIVGFGLSQGLDDLPGKRADIGAAMAADLGLVPHSAQGKPDKIAPRGPGNGFGQGGLAHARRTDKAEDGPFDLFGQALNGQVFQDPLLRLFQPVVVFIRGSSPLPRCPFSPWSARPRAGR